MTATAQLDALIQQTGIARTASFDALLQSTISQQVSLDVIIGIGITASIARRNIDSYLVSGTTTESATICILATRNTAAYPTESQIIAGVDGNGDAGVGFGVAHDTSSFSIDVFGEQLSEESSNSLHIAAITPAAALPYTLYNYAFTEGSDTLTIELYASHNILSSSSSISRVIFVIHGSNIDANNYYNNVANTIRGLNNVVLLAPRFKETEQTPAVTELYWGTGWRQGNLSVTTDRPFRKSSFEVIDDLIVQCRSSYPNLEEIVISGFSAGGQFCTRYAATQTATDLRFVIGGASSYIWMDNTRPGPRVTGDNDYKYGLDNLSVTGYVDDIGATALRSRFAAAKVLTLCGTMDVGDIGGLDTTDPAMAQGADRTERMLNYRNHLISYYGSSIETTHLFEFVSGAAHDSALVLGSYSGRRVYFGVYF